MSRELLHARLLAPTFLPKNTVQCLLYADEWFRREGTAAAFVVRALFQDLVGFRGWDGASTGSSGEWTRFTADVLPRLIGVLAAVDPAEEERAAMALLPVWHRFVT